MVKLAGESGGEARVVEEAVKWAISFFPDELLPAGELAFDATLLGEEDEEEDDRVELLQGPVSRWLLRQNSGGRARFRRGKLMTIWSHAITSAVDEEEEGEEEEGEERIEWCGGGGEETCDTGDSCDSWSLLLWLWCIRPDDLQPSTMASVDREELFPLQWLV